MASNAAPAFLSISLAKVTSSQRIFHEQSVSLAKATDADPAYFSTSFENASIQLPSFLNENRLKIIVVNADGVDETDEERTGNFEGGCLLAQGGKKIVVDGELFWKGLNINPDSPSKGDNIKNPWIGLENYILEMKNDHPVIVIFLQPCGDCFAKKLQTIVRCPKNIIFRGFPPMEGAYPSENFFWIFKKILSLLENFKKSSEREEGDDDEDGAGEGRGGEGEVKEKEKEKEKEEKEVEMEEEEVEGELVVGEGEGNREEDGEGNEEREGEEKKEREEKEEKEEKEKEKEEKEVEMEEEEVEGELVVGEGEGNREEDGEGTRGGNGEWDGDEEMGGDSVDDDDGGDGEEVDPSRWWLNFFVALPFLLILGDTDPTWRP